MWLEEAAEPEGGSDDESLTDPLGLGLKQSGSLKDAVRRIGAAGG